MKNGEKEDEIFSQANSVEVVAEDIPEVTTPMQVEGDPTLVPIEELQQEDVESGGKGGNNVGTDTATQETELINTGERTTRRIRDLPWEEYPATLGRAPPPAAATETGIGQATPTYDQHMGQKPHQV